MNKRAQHTFWFVLTYLAAAQIIYRSVAFEYHFTDGERLPAIVNYVASFFFPLIGGKLCLELALAYEVEEVRHSPPFQWFPHHYYRHYSSKKTAPNLEI